LSLIKAPAIPATHVLPFVEMAVRKHLPEVDILAALGMRRSDLSDPHATVTVDAAVRAFERARALVGDPAIGWYAGLEMSATAHGYLGFAAMSAATLGEAIALVVQYASIRTSVFSFTLEVDGSVASLVVHEHADFGTARDIVLLTLLVGIWQVGNHILGREVRESTVRLALPHPGYGERLRSLVPRVFFDQPAHRLAFDASLLGARLTTANEASLRLSLDQCERLRTSASPLADRVRSLVFDAKGAVRTLEEVAALLHLSPRTLRRHLVQEQVSFAEVVEAERYARATLLLRSRELSLGQIANRLGYGSVRSFARAFQRWSGVSPGEARGGD
jgi:AraC-like DNA-binding protein